MLWLEAPATWLGLLATAHSKAVFRAYFRVIRFKSVLVENDAEALATVAAYIDLNSVRAGMVKQPEDYRWSGYGEAVGGKQIANEGIKAVFDEGDWRNASKWYRRLLFGMGSQGAEDHGGKSK